MILKAVVSLVCLSLVSLEVSSHGTNSRSWTKMNGPSICFGARSNSPGVIIPVVEGFLAAVKLVHLNGKVACKNRPLKPHHSNWGCYKFPALINSPLNVFVTDDNDKILFPKVGAKFTTGRHRPGKWYSLPGFNSRSGHLVLQHGFSTPYYVGPNSRLKVWYGEDLFNYTEFDNNGNVCVDVYGYFV